MNFDQINSCFLPFEDAPNLFFFWPPRDVSSEKQVEAKQNVNHPLM